MAKKMYQGLLKSVTAVTPTIRELVLTFSEPLPFQAGQFVVLHIPHEGKLAPRAYSIATSEQEPMQISLLFKLVPGGIASEYVRALKGGETLPFTGPFGKCLFLVPPTPQVVFVATGAGLSQHLSFLRSKAAAFPQTRFRLLLGVWNEVEVFYQSELEQLQKSLKNFSFEYVLDQGPQSWTGKTGFVTRHLDQFNFMTTTTTFYLCGNPAMIKAVKQLLTERGFDIKMIKEEAFN